MDSVVHPSPLRSTPTQSNFDRNSGMHPKTTVPHRCQTSLPLPTSKSIRPNRQTSNTITGSTERCASSFDTHRHSRGIPTAPILGSFRFGISSPKIDNSPAMCHRNWIANCIIRSDQVGHDIFVPSNLQCQRPLLRSIFSYNILHCWYISIHLHLQKSMHVERGYLSRNLGRSRFHGCSIGPDLLWTRRMPYLRGDLTMNEIFVFKVCHG